MSATRKVGDLKTIEVKEGFIYTLQYFVLDDDKGSYTPRYGLDGNTAPFEFPAGTYIRRWEDEPMGDHWLITVEAVNDGFDDGDGGSEFGTANDRVTKSYNVTEIFFHPEWWGVIKCKSSHLTDGVLLDINGKTAKENMWIYANFADDTPTYQGEPDYSMCPFLDINATALDATTGPANMPISLMNKKVPTIMYYVKLLSETGDTNAMENYLKWTGVSGDATSFENGAVPTGYSTAGRWLAKDQKLKEKGETLRETVLGVETDVEYDVVERWMLKAPGDLTWNPDSFGGTWTWR